MLDVPAQAREHLVIAFLTDTVQAALCCPAVRTFTVVTDDAHAGPEPTASPRSYPTPVSTATSPPSARSRTDDHPLAALLADLPGSHVSRADRRAD